VTAPGGTAGNAGTLGERWRARVAPLLEGLPSRPRALGEAVFIVLVVLAGEVEGSWVYAFGLAAAGVALLRPWRRDGGGIVARAATSVAAIALIVLPTVLAGAAHDAAQTRRIGVGIDAVAPRAEDPPAAGGVLEVREVTSGATAQGKLAPGDRIVALDGAPLDAVSPSRDFVRRLQTAGDEAAIDIVRDHHSQLVMVAVPRLRAAPAPWRVAAEFARNHFLLGVALRAVCVMALVLLLLRADGQRFGALGLVGRRAWFDALIGFPLTIGAFVTALGAGIAVSIVAMVAGSSIVQRESVSRTTTLLDLFGDTSLGAFAAAIAVTATFEEVVFRGFLLPRLRRVTGSWIAAVSIASLLFGVGHMYEGWTAVVQTTALGVFFSGVFLVSARLLPAVVAHASFDVAVFMLLTWLQRSGFLDDARKMITPH
jgi:membrane protease YdiL (CAAX protease family)